MSLRKREFLPQNIKTIRTVMKKENGQVSRCMGLFLVLFLAVYLFAALQLERFRAASLYLEDALAASNLASAVVDIEQFGISHRIWIPDVSAAYEKYREAVRGNLNLDEAWRAADGGVIEGTVKVVNYTIYNVNGELVTVSSFDENGQTTENLYVIGAVKAPNGTEIESTSVYSEIAFMVEGFPGMYVEAHKGCLVDVVK